MVVASASEIPPGEGRNFDVGGLQLAVFHTRSGQVFATDARCPHRQGPLADGLVGERHVVCPLHDRTFDLGSGESRGGDCSVKTYPATLDAEGQIVVEFPQE